jgi:hypothetical protein
VSALADDERTQRIRPVAQLDETLRRMAAHRESALLRATRDVFAVVARDAHWGSSAEHDLVDLQHVLAALQDRTGDAEAPLVEAATALVGRQLATLRAHRLHRRASLISATVHATEAERRRHERWRPWG